MDKLQAVDQKMSLFYETGIRVPLATYSVFHAWKEIVRKAGLGSFVVSVHLNILYRKHDRQFKVLGELSDVLSSDC